MRFNEAEAIKPRIQVARAARLGDDYYSFNEAEAIKPRIPIYLSPEIDLIAKLQ